jgi:signal peptidase II|tara:strand:+ start:370 stop:864 length:495 start_codon:yes stop_codon:yes gene_type:complete
MIKLNFKKLLIHFCTILIIFFIDRLSKIYILNIAETTGNVDIYLNPYLNLFLVWNKGIGFGLLSFEESTVYNFITLLIILINLVIVYLIYKSDDIREYFFIVIFGGSLGNLFDRLYYSAVPDFIDLNYNGYHWFIFNVADIFITLGIICLIFVELLNYKKTNEN